MDSHTSERQAAWQQLSGRRDGGRHAYQSIQNVGIPIAAHFDGLFLTAHAAIKRYGGLGQTRPWPASRPFRHWLNALLCNVLPTKKTMSLYLNDLLVSPFTEFFGDGDCDSTNNNAWCGFDSGDCCSCTCMVRGGWRDLVKGPLDVDEWP